jgi:hypothetical protein
VKGCKWTLIVAFAMLAPTSANAKASKLQKSLLGCWEYKRPDPKDWSSNLACFNRKGIVNGVTVDASEGEGWDWRNDYTLNKDEISFNGKAWGRIQQLDTQTMIIESEGKVFIYKFICRTKTQNVRCGRLAY